MKTIVLTDAALKDLLGLPERQQIALEDALDRYATTGVGDMTPLKGSDYRRLRVGRYRVIFGEDAVTILAISIGKRDGQTYRKGKTR